MGKLNIQGDLDIHNYLTATNTNLYLSSVADYSIRFRIGTTEVARINPSGCLCINTTSNTDAYKLYVGGASLFSSSAYFRSNIWANNSSIGGSIAFLPTRSTDNNATGIINYYACGSTSATSYNLGSFYFTQYSYASGTYNRVEYYDRYYLPSVAADKTSNNTYGILTTKNTITVAQGGTGRSSLTSGYALVGNGTNAVSLREITSTATSGSTALVTSGGAYNIASQAITNITRSGTTFTATRVDGTTFTFTQRDNNTTYTFTNKAATLAWSTTSTIATVGGVDITVTMPANPNTNTDTKVQQSRSTSTSWRPLLSHYTATSRGTDPSAATNICYYNEKASIKPSTGEIYAAGGITLGGALKWTSALTNVSSPTVLATFVGNDSANGLGYCNTSNVTVGNATYSTLWALTGTANTTTGHSDWDGGVGNTNKYTVYDQEWACSKIGSDTGDLRVFVRPGVYTSGGTEVCFAIDGDFYVMGHKVQTTAGYGSTLPSSGLVGEVFYKT